MKSIRIKRLHELIKEIDAKASRGPSINMLTATEDQRQAQRSDEAFDHALQIIWKMTDATLQEAVAYLKSKPPSFETIAVLACLSPLAAKYEQAIAAAAKKPAPAWHAEAKREAARLIEQGTAPRYVASKIARMPKFSGPTLKAIRNAVK